MTSKKQRPHYSPEVRERAVRMVIEHEREHTSQLAAIVSIAVKIGCTPQTLHNWVAQSERDAGKRLARAPKSASGSRCLSAK